MKKTLSPRQIFERSLRESDVVGAIINLLELNRARVFKIVERIPWGKTTSTPGLPDLMGYWPAFIGINSESGTDMRPVTISAKHFFIEVKKPGGRRRPAQTAWIEAARADGVVCFFADSVEAMVAGFKEYGITIRGLEGR